MPGLCDLPGVNVACNIVGDTAQGVAGSVIDAAATAFAEALGKLTATLLTFWTNVTLPDLSSPSGPVAFIQTSTGWLTGFVLIISLMIAGAKMAIQQNFEAGQEAATGVWQMVLYAGAGIPGIALLGVAGDQFSQWILDRSSGGDLGARLGQLFTLGALNPIGTGLVLVVALVGIFSALGQMFLMIIRVGMVVLLAGMLPLSAAAAVSKGGKEWFTKTLGWLLAFLAYKPAAAIIYATAFAMVGKGDNATTVLSGLFLIALSILALPALLRLTVPVTAAVAGGAAGAGAGGAIAAGGALATGAIQMRAMSGSAGGHGGGRADGPSGSPTVPGAGRTGGGQATTGQIGARPGTPTPTGIGGAGMGAGRAAAAGPAGAGVAASAQAVQGGLTTTRNAANHAAGEGSDGGPTGADRGEQHR